MTNFIPREQCDQIAQNFATWQHFKRLRQYLEGLFSFGQYLEPTLAK